MKTLALYNPLGFFVLLKKEVVRFTRIYIQTLLAPLLSNILFLAIFGGMFKTRQIGIEGVSYLTFLAPGLVAMGAIFSAFQNPAGSLISQKYQGTLQDLNSYPLSVFEKTMAFVLGGTIRGILVGLFTYLATIYFVGSSIQYPLLFIGMVAVASFIFSSCGVIAGLVYENFEKFNFLFTLIITPLTYLGGVFFEVSKLPGFSAKLVYVNPLFYIVNSIRFGYLGVAEGVVWFHIALTLLLAAISFTSAYLTIKKGVGLTQ